MYKVNVFRKFKDANEKLYRAGLQGMSKASAELGEKIGVLEIIEIPEKPKKKVKKDV